MQTKLQLLAQKNEFQHSFLLGSTVDFINCQLPDYTFPQKVVSHTNTPLTLNLHCYVRHCQDYKYATLNADNNYNETAKLTSFIDSDSYNGRFSYR